MEIGSHPQITVSVTIDTSVDDAFQYIVPIELSHIFKKYKFLPGVIKTNETEKWYKPGLKRTVFFDDGSTAQEKLLTVIENQSFSYEIDGFSSSLKHLTKRIEGQWLFAEMENGQVKIDWTYTVVPKNRVASVLVKWVLLPNIKGLLGNALKIIKNDLEKK